MAKDSPHPGSDASAKPEWAMSRRERRRAERARQGLPPPRRLWPWVLLVLLAAAGALAWVERERLAALMPPPAETEAAAPAAAPPPALTQINVTEWSRIEPATLRRAVRVIGTLAPARQAAVAAVTGGQVEAVLARAGDRVGQGDLLVRLDVERLQIDLDLARSNLAATQSQLALAEGQLERSRALVERGVSAETTLDEVRTNVEGLRANLAAQQDQVRAAELALSRASVFAPFDGVVAERTVEAGGVVGAGAPLMTIVDLSRMEMLAQASVSAGALVEPGQRVAIRVEGIEGHVFEGEVSRIAPVAAEGTRTLTVYVTVENPDGRLLGGMFATGEIVLAEAEGALAVPAEALREDAEGPFLLVVEDGVLVRRGVALGEEWPGGLVQVAEGLSGGEMVVTAPLVALEPGEAVALVEF